MNTLLLRLETHSVRQTLSSLSHASDRSPEFRDSLLGLLNYGEELFAIDGEVRIATWTDNLVVGFKPTDSLLDLISAFRASYPDSLIFEHPPHPFRSEDCNITYEGLQ